MSILSGYPVGAKITCDLYNNKQIDSAQAHRIVAFTSTSGPLFILGTVAIGMFNNLMLGYVVAISHFLGALINGLIYRNYLVIKKSTKIETLNFNKKNNVLEEAMFGSIKSILIVGGYVGLFFMIITVLNHYNILFLPNFLICKIFPMFNPEIVGAITNGIIELTRGCLDLGALNLSPKLSAPILSGLISFGGISIFLQAATFLKGININLKFYFLQKITHCVLSVVLSIMLCCILF